ncbi:roadblock/LC7 domain-containing protein [Acaryochloris sp. IP29b_bin.137]|uniref:roadblock/LC7 domain-containing protein n=1 Tax=Acaryochloris sp. IP29b_bin.137 TaxID=2969217 RepID=UPI0026100B9E|nr:roadblock/LC7 domain-containing protein [Acaryochloris sp. IP29b_bin.137]
MLVTNTVLRQDSGESNVSSSELTLLNRELSPSIDDSAPVLLEPIMLQSLGQLVYTSFPNTGFRHLSSPQIPKEIQHAFVHQVVYLRWNSYNPPAADYRAAYLYQINANHTLFGWLYGDATDDVGRHVPYFVSYHLAEPLTEAHLNSIFICLQRGPISIVNKSNLSNGALDNVSIPDIRGYPPIRIGVDIPDDIRNYSRTFLQMQELLNIFVPATDRQSRLASYQNQQSDDLAQSLATQKTILQPSNKRKTDPTPQLQSSSAEAAEAPAAHAGSSEMSYVNQILHELIAKPIGIQSAFLVSLEGLPITSPVGISEDSALIIAGTMLYLARSTHEELQWQGIEKITVQAQEGYVILANCTSGVFLLVKAAKALTGLLDGEINRTVKRLQTALELENIDKDTELSPEARGELVNQLSLDQPVAHSSEAANHNHQIKYRGNAVQ